MTSSKTQPKPSLVQVLEHWQDYGIGCKPALVRTFTAGLNHASYLLQVAQQKLVLKIFTNPQPNAIRAQQWAAKLGLAPNINFVSQEHDLILMQHVESDTINATKIRSEDLVKFGAALKLLHHSPSESLHKELGEFDLLQFCHEYLHGLDEEIKTLHTRLLPALEPFINDTTAWTLCHNDLVSENCFVERGKVVFIDWEYAQLHNPWFDLAGIVLYFDLSQKQAKVLFDGYQYGWSEKVATPIYYSTLIALLWIDILWHLAKYGMNYSLSMQSKWARLSGLASELDTPLIF